MFTESLIMAPAAIGLVLYLFLGTVGLVWYLARSSTRKVLIIRQSEGR